MKKIGAILLTMSFVTGTFSTAFADVQPKYGNTGYVYYCVGRGMNPEIVETAVDVGAETSVGWMQDVSSTGIQTWIETVMDIIIEDNATFSSAAIQAITILNGKIPVDVTLYDIKGNENLKLAEDRNKSSESYVKEFDYVDENIVVDFQNGDIEELTKYFAKTVDGFDENTCEVEALNPNQKIVVYRQKYGDYVTPFKLTASVLDGKIIYSSNLDKIESLKSLILLDAIDDLSEDVYEKAKEEASKYNIQNGDIIDKQIVTKCIDEEGKPYLLVETTYVDAFGCSYLDEYKFYLN